MLSTCCIARKVQPKEERSAQTNRLQRCVVVEIGFIASSIPVTTVSCSLLSQPSSDFRQLSVDVFGTCNVHLNLLPNEEGLGHAVRARKEVFLAVPPPQDSPKASDIPVLDCRDNILVRKFEVLNVLKFWWRSTQKS